jgi:protein TonB
VRTEGVDFPFPGYLENIVRQIALRFRPPGNTAVRAEVMFLIRRDGTVTDFRFISRSGNFAFDLECQGAVDQAAEVKAFGPLPAGFSDDVLPVIFSFDPRVLR